MESLADLDCLAQFKYPSSEVTSLPAPLSNSNRIPLELLFSCLEEVSEAEETAVKKLRLRTNSPISPLDLASSASSTSASSSQHSPVDLPNLTRLLCARSRKPPEPIPTEKKDQAYYAKRRKNNDAAKRSRDARRMKEEQTAQRAAELEEENQTLKQQIQRLQEQLSYYRTIKSLSESKDIKSNLNQEATQISEMAKNDLLRNSSVLLSLLNNSSLFSFPKDIKNEI